MGFRDTDRYESNYQDSAKAATRMYRMRQRGYTESPKQKGQVEHIVCPKCNLYTPTWRGKCLHCWADLVELLHPG